MHDPESPASREEAHLLPDEWLKIKPVPGNGNLSPGVYYPTVKRFVDARQPATPNPALYYFFLLLFLFTLFFSIFYFQLLLLYINLNNNYI